MVLAKVDAQPASIDGFPFDESVVTIADIAAFTHNKFHEAADVLRQSNTLDGIFKLFIDEVDELLEYLEKSPGDRINVVAEWGDLLHLWNDLFQLSDASVMTLLNFLDLNSIENEDLTIYQIKEAATQKYEKEAEARDLLYELKVVLRLGDDEEINDELIGIIASHIFAVAAILNINAIYAVLMKNKRNREKYHPQKMDEMFHDGVTYPVIRKKMIVRWNNGLGGDPKFFENFTKEFPVVLSYAVVSGLASDTN